MLFPLFSQNFMKFYFKTKLLYQIKAMSSDINLNVKKYIVKTKKKKKKKTNKSFRVFNYKNWKFIKNADVRVPSPYDTCKSTIARIKLQRSILS